MNDRVFSQDSVILIIYAYKKEDKIMLCAYCFTKTESHFENFKDICMDGYSHDNLLEHLDYIFQMCPCCKIVSDDISKNLKNKEYAEFVFEKYQNCKEYQMVLNDTTIKPLEKKLLLAQILYENSIDVGCYNSNIDLTLFTYYHAIKDDKKAEKHLNNKMAHVDLIIKNEKAFYETEILTQEVLSNCMDDILELIDMLRQVGEFKIATEYIEMVKGYKFNKYTRNAKSRLRIQEKLCKSQNCDRVLAPQVKDSNTGIII